MGANLPVPGVVRVWVCLGWGSRAEATVRVCTTVASCGAMVPSRDNPCDGFLDDELRVVACREALFRFASEGGP